MIICQSCEQPFERPKSTGMKPRYCGVACRAAMEARRQRTRPTCSSPGCSSRTLQAGLCAHHYRVRLKAAAGTCSIHKCEGKATRAAGTLCETHYYRHRRTGTTDKRARAVTPRSDGYLVIFSPAHPLAQKNGHLFEHRRVLFEKIGLGEHPCHWCRRTLKWKARWEDAIVADHHDGDRSNNAPENLVPSCHDCNTSRGSFQAWVRARASDNPERMAELICQLLPPLVLDRMADLGLLKKDTP